MCIRQTGKSICISTVVYRMKVKIYHANPHFLASFLLYNIELEMISENNYFPNLYVTRILVLTSHMKATVFPCLHILRSSLGRGPTRIRAARGHASDKNTEQALHSRDATAKC